MTLFRLIEYLIKLKIAIKFQRAILDNIKSDSEKNPIKVVAANIEAINKMKHFKVSKSTAGGNISEKDNSIFSNINDDEIKTSDLMRKLKQGKIEKVSNEDFTEPKNKFDFK